MRIVTIAAGHARLIHAALQEGSVHVDFTLDLPIGVIQALIEQRRHVSICQRLAKFVLLGERGAT